MTWLMRHRGKVVVGLALLAAAVVMVYIATAGDVVRVIACLGRSLNDRPCEPVEIRSASGPRAAWAIVLLAVSASPLAGWWWLARHGRRREGPWRDR